MSLQIPPTSASDRAAAATSGLCAECAYLQVLRSRRSTFIRCARHDNDSSWPRYPRLPVLHCHGFERHEPSSADSPLGALL